MRLQEKYTKEIIPVLKERFGHTSSMAVPRIEKVVVNTGFGRIATSMTGEEQRTLREAIANDIARICGQKPVFKRARKSISSFKLRQGMIVGVTVTLRGKRMYDFLERLIHIALPRSRDFRGIDPEAVDGSGNLTIAVREHIIFPEVSAERARQIFGFEATIVTTARNKEKGLEFLRLMGFPIKS